MFHHWVVVKSSPNCSLPLDKLTMLFRCKPMDAEDCEPYTDVYWIKFYRVDNARFAKRKLDESVFLGNRIQVSYAPQYETPSDAKEKLEGRRKEVLARLNSKRSQGSSISRNHAFVEPSSVSGSAETYSTSQTSDYMGREFGQNCARYGDAASMTFVSSDKDYFPSESMNRTVHLVREKLDKIKSSVEHVQAGSAKRARVDNRRRI